ncbi:MAG: M28 family peptidase, partial [Acidobacteria bacterium]|nr:M28 family peptidase [Acidobacteriota bacterium]
MSFCRFTRPLRFSLAIILLLAFSASPRPADTVLVRMDRPAKAVIPDGWISSIKVLQELDSCFLVEVPVEMIAGLEALGIRLEVLDTSPAGKPYYLVYHAVPDEHEAMRAFGEVRRIEEDISLFWAGSEDVREILPSHFKLKRLPENTRIRLEAAVPQAQPPVRAVEPRHAALITQMADMVSGQRLAAAVQALQDFRTRYASTAGCEAAGEYLDGYFGSLDLETAYDQFSFGAGHSSRNIVAVLPGRISPEYSVILCAHYDSASDQAGTLAPGADDNASGVAALMEMARILSLVPLDFTVKFICFSAEEWGLLGSRHYALE